MTPGNAHMLGIDSMYLLRSQVILDLILQLFTNALGRDGVEVGVGQDLVDDGAVGGSLLWGNCMGGRLADVWRKAPLHVKIHDRAVLHLDRELDLRESAMMTGSVGCAWRCDRYVCVVKDGELSWGVGVVCARDNACARD